MTPNLGNSERDALEHFRAVWTKLTGGRRGPLHVVCLRGNGRDPAWEDDQKLLTRELARIRI